MENEPPKVPQLTAYAKASLALLITGLVDLVVSFSTSYWATWSAAHKSEHGGYGLWNIWHCAPHKEISGMEKMFGTPANILKESIGCEVRMADSSFPEWYVATQVLQTLALACLLSCIIMLIVYICLPSRRHWRLMSAIVGLAYSAGSLIVVAVFVFGFKVAEEVQELGATEWALSWSFSMSCTACLLLQIAACVLVAERKKLMCPQSDEQTEEEEDDQTVQSVLLPHLPLLPQLDTMKRAQLEQIKSKDFIPEEIKMIYSESLQTVIAA